MDYDPQIPRYAQPQVLKITGLRPAVLQTWINRKAIELAEQNPGSGKKRLYSELDVIKLAIMRRLADLSVDLSISKGIAEVSADRLAANDGFEWDLSIILKPKAASTSPRFPIPSYVRDDLLEKLHPLFPDHRTCDVVRGSLAAYTLSMLAEPSDSMPPHRYKRDWMGEGQSAPEPNIDGKEWWARLGMHAEPFIFVPLGEIVNGTLAQLEALDEANSAGEGD